jgi:hypothetical protein
MSRKMNLFFLSKLIVALVESFSSFLPMIEGNRDLSIRLKYFFCRGDVMLMNFPIETLFLFIPKAK